MKPHDQLISLFSSDSPLTVDGDPGGRADPLEAGGVGGDAGVVGGVLHPRLLDEQVAVRGLDEVGVARAVDLGAVLAPPRHRGRGLAAGRVAPQDGLRPQLDLLRVRRRLEGGAEICESR